MASRTRTSRYAVRKATRPAFTLIEVLATMALLSIVLPSIMGGISLCMSMSSLARQQSQASALCHDKLMDLVASGDWEYATLSGDFGPDQSGYRWTAQIQDWDASTLRQLDVTVWWRQGNAERSVTLSTLLYSGAGETS